MPRLYEPAELRKRRDESFYQRERHAFLIIFAMLALDALIAVWR